MSVSAICVDDGEPNLTHCIQSLRNQTIPVRVVVAAGPKTDLAFAEKIADKVYQPTCGIGRARVNAILNEKAEYVLSCDADSVYDSRYAEFALEDLRSAKAVKAGIILPLEWNHPLVLLETLTTLIPPYEFCLGFRKNALLDVGIVEEMKRYGQNKRWDIGRVVVDRLNAWPDYRLLVYTRMPTKGAYEFSEKYLLSAVAGATPILAVSSIPLTVTLASHV